MKRVKRLGGKKQLFIIEYLKDLNALQAAKRAGYSDKSAPIMARNLMKDPDVQMAIEEGKAEALKMSQIDSAWLLNRLVAEASADLNDLYYADGTLKAVQDWPLIWRQGLVSGIESEEINIGKGRDKQTIGTVSKVKLSDRLKRLELIGQHVDVNAFRQQVGLSDANGGPVQIREMSDDELKSKLLSLLRQQVIDNEGR